MSSAQNELSPLQQMLSSCSGALITSLTMTPFDVVKTRIQAQNQPNFVKHQQLCARLLCNGLMEHVCVCKVETEPVRFNGTWDAFVKIQQREGVASLWRGLPPTLVMAVPSTVIYFTAYDRLRSKFGAQFGQRSPLTPILSGVIARTIAVTVISPLELIRTKMQATAELGYADLKDVVKRTVRTEGYRSLWRGLGPSLLRDVPFSALYWLGYEQIKYRLSTSTNIKSHFTINFISGAVSGTCAATLTLPFDVIKTRQQSMLGELLLDELSSKKAKPRVEKAWEIARDITRTHGWQGLFAGIIPRIAKVAPACAIMISSYEFGKEFFSSQNARQELLFLQQQQQQQQQHHQQQQLQQQKRLTHSSP